MAYVDNATRRDTRALAEKLIAFFPAGWTFVPEEIQFQGPEGQVVSLSPWNGRCSVSGSLPGFQGCSLLRNGEEAPSMTVSLSREPSAIGRDIQRRFLSQYLDLFARTSVRKVEFEQQVDQQNRFARKLAKLFGETPPEHSPSSFYLVGPGPATHAEVRVDRGDNVRMVLSVPWEQAEAVLRLVREMWRA